MTKKGDNKMIRLVLCIGTMLILYLPNEEILKTTYQNIISYNRYMSAMHPITKMEALDLVKLQYAANFKKIYLDTKEDYYYKLSSADYYLDYEGEDETEQEYLFRLYEFVLDDSETGIGHYVTYGWYTVNWESKEITDTTQ